ncbi:MAG: aminotransferase class I/II-fold pyridoxal phosphate-dependent enzyme [Geminicoccaceae bacterium]
MTNELLAGLGEFPFRRLALRLGGVKPPDGLDVIDLGIGEPQHQPPALLAETVARNAHLWNRYPPVNGTAEYRAAAAGWLSRRYDLPAGTVDPDRNLLPLAGTKEGIYLLAACVVPPRKNGARPVVMMPNPVYAVYQGAAVMAGAEPVMLAATRDSGFLPDLDSLDPQLLARTALFYLCTPANPQGAAADMTYLRRLVRLARQHGFVLSVDECYTELWDREPPPGGLAAALAEDGTLDNVVVLHSLSKRSNAAGLRSGFIAGDARVIADFFKLRAYASAVQPLPLMAAGTALWGEESHVEANRAAYRRKFDIAERRLSNRFGFYRPDGGFFLWLDVGDGEAAAVRLWQEAALRVLPGGYLGVTAADGSNPGQSYIRLAMVHDEALIAKAVDRLVEVLG